MMKKRLPAVLVLLSLIAASPLFFIVTSCSDEIVVHEVVFDGQGGTDVSTATVADGQKLNEPASPSKSGYSFDGWYEESECIYRWNFEKDVVVSDMTLYAKWTINTYVVSYHANGATNGSVPTGHMKTHGVDVAVWGNTGTLVKEGYTFVGWNTQENGLGTDYAVGSPYTVDEAVILFAKWEPNTNTAYVVEHYQQDVSTNEYIKYETEYKFGTTESTADAVAKNYTGFTVNIGHESSVASGTIAADGTLVLKLYYDRDVFTVYFVENEGSSVSDLTGVRYGATVPAPTDPTRIGYSFNGWYKDSNLHNAWSFSDDVITDTTELYAKWSANSYTITYVLNNGTNDAGNPATYTIETATITMQAPTRTGYPFEGWFSSSDFFGSPITQIHTGSVGDLTLYAKWKAYQVGTDLGPAGGYVFYDKGTCSNGWQYLEAAPYGWYEGTTDSDGPYSGEEDPFFEWGVCGFPIDPSALGTAIGSGMSNTANIVHYHNTLGAMYPLKGEYYSNPTQYCVNNDGTVAAKVCDEYSLELGEVTYGDWFLPSKDELNLIYRNLFLKGLGGFDDYAYWSSSESSDINSAYSQYFLSGFQGFSNRYNDFMVRPVRAF